MFLLLLHSVFGFQLTFLPIVNKWLIIQRKYVNFLKVKKKTTTNKERKKKRLTHHYNYPHLQTRKLSRNNIRIKQKKKDHRRTSDRKRF